jgi:hypothetical protein
VRVHERRYDAVVELEFFADLVAAEVTILQAKIDVR